MKRRTALLAAVLAALVTAGCTTSIAGSPTAATSGAGTAGPSIPEAGADWAVSALDPCALLADTPVDTTGSPFATKPHNCGVEYTLPSGEKDRLVVRVGIAFTTADRARSSPTTISGLRAYQIRDTEVDSYRPPQCVIDIPISATRSVQLEALSLGGELEAACSNARRAAEPVAAKLADPGRLTRNDAPTSLGRWHACDLLETATGLYAERDALGSSSADECSAVAETGPDSPNTDIETTTGPAELEQPAADDRLVTLPRGPGLLKSYGTFCTLTFVAEQLPGAPTAYAAQITTLKARGAQDNCGAATDAGTAIQNTLAKPAPAPPAPPTKLGFAEGQTDDIAPVACGRIGNAASVNCREAQPVDVPKGARALLALDSKDPATANVTCTILKTVAESVIGPTDVAAFGDGSCIAADDSGFSATLGFWAADPAAGYCTGFDLEKQDIRIANRPGIRCAPSAATFNTIMPALGADPAAPGVVLVDGTIDHPRGARNTDRAATDDTRVSELTTKIVEGVITQYLS
ncbi:hypothetical protein WEH80_25890 [Actinomycetes bacterium KLBMP 9759]